jgi:glutamyl-tRNA synthetase
MSDHLVAIDRAFAELPTFDAVSLEAALRTVADARRVKAATLIHAVRVAVTGKAVSPGLFEVVALVGRERTHDRLLAAARLISTRVP